MDPSQKQAKPYYSVLGLGNDASSLAIRNAYKKLAMKWHPDKCGTEDQAGAKLKFQEIQEAYAVLSDNRKKILYDNGLLDPDDDEEDIEGMSCFLNEMTRTMAEMQATEKDGRGPSFEELQQLLVDSFSSDFKAAPLNSSLSFHLSSSAQHPDKKRSWRSQGFAASLLNMHNDSSASYESCIYLGDFFDYGNVVPSGGKRQKSSSQQESTSSRLAVQLDAAWQVDRSLEQHYACGCRRGWCVMDTWYR